MVVMLQREVPCAPAVEVALHQRFSDRHVRGEWFDLGPDAARIVGEACDEITADLPVSALSAAAEKDLGYDLYVLSPNERVWRDAGRWYDSVTEHPEYVTAGELAGHVRAFADEPLWGDLSEPGTRRLVYEAYADSGLKVPGGYEVEGNRIPARLISWTWECFKLTATIEPRLAPHCGISPEDAEAKAEELRTARKGRELAGAAS
jgi:hypothetical protein